MNEHNKEIKIMKELTQVCSVQVQELANALLCSNTRDTCGVIFDFVLAKFNYSRDADPPGLVTLKSAAIAWHEKEQPISVQNIAIVISSLLKCLDIPFEFRTVAVDDKPYFCHIYVIVPDSNTKKGYIAMDVTMKEFDKESPRITNIKDV